MKKVIVLIVISFTGFSGSEAQNLKPDISVSRVIAENNHSALAQNGVVEMDDSGSLKNISRNIR